MNRIVRILFLFLISIQMLSAQEHVNDEAVINGLRELESGHTEIAAKIFRDVLNDNSMLPFYPEVLYWLVKADIVLEQYDEASRAADGFIHSFPEHQFIEEMYYQRARLLFLEVDADDAIRAFGYFIIRYPDSVFVSSAYYWIGESLMSLGRLEEADVVFSDLLSLYPASVKREAARYRRSEISLLFRERELLNLLKWSHEEYLQDSEDFYRRESELVKAAADILGRLSISSHSELEALYTKRLLESKEQLLTLQESYIDELLGLFDAQ